MLTSMVAGSSWPTLGDFVFRKPRKKGRRGRRASRVMAREARKRDRALASRPVAPTDPKDIAPAPMLRRTYGGITIASDPFKGATCPGCARVLDASCPPIMFEKGDPLFAFAGYCVVCVQAGRLRVPVARRVVVAVPTMTDAARRHIARLTYTGGARSAIPE